jgi:hypothetical protein
VQEKQPLTFPLDPSGYNMTTHFNASDALEEHEHTQLERR